MKEFEGASFKQRVAKVLTFIGWRCINVSYRMMGMGIELDESENDFITRLTGRISETTREDICNIPTKRDTLLKHRINEVMGGKIGR